MYVNVSFSSCNVPAMKTNTGSVIEIWMYFVSVFFLYNTCASGIQAVIEQLTQGMSCLAHRNRE